MVLGEFGEVFLLDWGLAKPTPGRPDADGVVGGEATATADGAVAGTPAYMAPELAVGGSATKTSDVYSLGAILYSILTGKPPAQGTSAQEVLRRVAESAPPPPRALNPAMPAALEAICLKAMARTPADRYASAEALATDLRRWLADEPVAAHRESFAVRAGRWARRRRTAVAAAAAVLVTVTLASAATALLVCARSGPRRRRRLWLKASGPGRNRRRVGPPRISARLGRWPWTLAFGLPPWRLGAQRRETWI